MSKHYYENGKPVNVYRNQVKLAGYHTETKSGDSVSFDGTYNDVADVELTGNTVQAVTAQGKNLFDKNKLFLEDSANLNYDGNYCELSGYSIIASSFGSPLFTHFMSLFVIGKTYTASQVVTIISGSFTGECGSIRFDNSTNGYFIITNKGVGAISNTFTIPYNFFTKWNISGTTLRFYGNGDGTGIRVKYSNIQIEESASATAYTPFVPNSPSLEYPSPIVDAVGNIKSNGVTAGAFPALRKVGTVADSHVMRTGVKTKRIEKIASYAGQSITTPYLSTTGALTTGATVLYQLETPVEESYTPTPVPTHLGQTIIETDSVVKPPITATAKVSD